MKSIKIIWEIFKAELLWHFYGDILMKECKEFKNKTYQEAIRMWIDIWIKQYKKEVKKHD